MKTHSSISDLSALDGLHLYVHCFARTNNVDNLKSISLRLANAGINYTPQQLKIPWGIALDDEKLSRHFRERLIAVLGDKHLPSEYLCLILVIAQNFSFLEHGTQRDVDEKAWRRLLRRIIRAMERQICSPAWSELISDVGDTSLMMGMTAVK